MALSLALLVLIYLRSRSRPTIEVSSLMLFDEAPAPVASVRHVRIDPLFWLEMATLSCADAGDRGIVRDEAAARPVTAASTRWCSISAPG